MGASTEDPSVATLFSYLRTDIWNTAEALFIQDGPFLLVHLTVMIYVYTRCFFTIKNVLLVTLLTLHHHLRQELMKLDVNRVQGITMH